MKIIKKIKIIYVPEYDVNYNQFVSFNVSKILPLGIAQLSAYLRDKGFIVDQDDLNIKVHYDNYHNNKKLDLSITSDVKRVIDYLKGGRDYQLKELIDKILSKTNVEGYEMVCFSCGYAENLYPLLISLLLAKQLKQENQNLIIVLGGSICSLSINICKKIFKFGYQNKIVDYFVIGRGEKALYNLILKLNKNEDPGPITGLMYFKNNELIEQGWGEHIFQKPDFQGLPLTYYQQQFSGRLNNLLIVPQKNILILPYEFISGCPNHCIFCGNSANNYLDYLSPQKIVKDLKELSKEYHTKYFFFLSNTINISKQFINELCDEIIRQKLAIFWSDCARFNNLDKETLEKMRKAGCIRLIYGFETGSPRMLKYIQKNITLEDASQVLQLTHETGIWAGLEIIAGLPTEREEDVDETIKFIEENDNFIDTIYVSPYHLVSGSLLMAQPRKYLIKNICEIGEFTNNKVSNYNSISQNYSYDEINGLKWEEKKRQINNSYQKILKKFDKKISGPLEVFYELPLIFSLYNYYQNKIEVKSQFKRLCFYMKIINSDSNLLVDIIRKKLYQLLFFNNKLF